MPKVVYSAIAERQIANIQADERFSEAARRAMVLRIVQACKGCAAHPLRFPKGERTGTRRRRVAPFIIYYMISEDGIDITAVWHERQHRDVDPAL